MIQNIFSMVLSLIGGVCVIVLTYYASKWYAKKMGTVGGGKHLNIIDRLIVSKTGSILVIDLEGTQYLVGVSEQNIQIMKQLEVPIPIQATQEIKKDHFINVLKALTNKEANHEK